VTDYDILGSSLVSVGCLAERKRTISRRVQRRSGMEQFRPFGTVFVKEDRETGKAVQKPCLFTRRSRSVQLDSRRQRLRLCRAIKSRTRATKSRDKIARVTSVLGGMLWLHGAWCVRVRVMFEASGRRHLGRASR